MTDYLQHDVVIFTKAAAHSHASKLKVKNNEEGVRYVQQAADTKTLFDKIKGVDEASMY